MPTAYPQSYLQRFAAETTRMPLRLQYTDRPDGPAWGVTPAMSARQGLRADQAFQSRADHRIEQLRVPPQSVEAEQAVLGGLMLAPDAYDRIADQLVDSDFYRRDHQLIFRAIRELAEKNRPYDAVTLGEWFESQGLGEQVAGGAYLVELASTCLLYTSDAADERSS